MSETFASAPRDHTVVNRWNYMGAVLIGLALLAPVFASLTGYGNWDTVGQDIGRLFGSLLGLGLIFWLVVRRMGDLAQARARAVVGALLCLVAYDRAVDTIQEEALARRFLADAIAFQAGQAMRFKEFGQRFEQISLYQHLTPAGLTSPVSVEAGSAALEQYRALLYERNLLMQTYWAESAAFIEKLPEGRLKAGAMSTFGPNRSAVQDVYVMLDRAQLKHADAIGAIFEWAKTNSGEVSLRNGQILFSSAVQQQQLQALAADLEVSEKAAADAERRAQATESEAQRHMQQLQEKAAQLIAN
jgi:hypothetical protein